MTARGMRRIWCELASAEEVLEPAVLSALRVRRIGLLFAVSPSEHRLAATVVRACRSASVPIGLWPLLSADEGRWANELTAHVLAPQAETLFDWLASEGALPDELAIDLEPPYELLARRDVTSLVRYLSATSADGAARLARWAAHTRGHGVRVIAAALPTILADGPSRRLERLTRTPVESLGAEHVTAMMYSSMVEGYSKGVFSRDDVRALLFRAAEAAAAKPNGGLSLGAVATGSLGDEPVYRDPAELADDVALSLGAGVRDLALFSLCGALRRPPLEGWLDAFVEEKKAARPPMTRKARAVWSALRVVGG